MKSLQRALLLLLAACLLPCAALAEIETTAQVNLRTGPDTSHRIITSVPQGTVLTDLDCMMVDEQERPWYWVAWEGQECWVCGDYAILTGTQESGAPTGDALSESRWISVSVQGDDGAEAYPADLGGCELWLFPDGTAHWQVFNGDGLLCQNPVGHWQRIGEDALVFYQTDTLETAEEWQLQRFEVTSEGLRTPWSGELTICLTQYDVTDRWLPLSREQVLGDWVMYAGETEGWEYSAQEEGIAAAICFAEATDGTLYFDYRWNDMAEKGTAAYSSNGLSGGSDLMTAWAPWYLRFELRSGEYAYAFMPNAAMLRVEKHYVLDGTPAVSTQDYARKD